MNNNIVILLRGHFDKLDFFMKYIISRFTTEEEIISLIIGNGFSATCCHMIHCILWCYLIISLRVETASSSLRHLPHLRNARVNNRQNFYLKALRLVCSRPERLLVLSLGHENKFDFSTTSPKTLRCNPEPFFSLLQSSQQLMAFDFILDC